jgi:hypothetical protein
MSNKQSIMLAPVLLALLVGVGYAGDKGIHQTGKLIDMRGHSTAAGALRAQRSFCLAIQVEDISYILHYEPAMRGNYEPTSLIIGDPIEVKIKGDKMYVKTGKKSTNDLTHRQTDDEVKMQILRRERIAPDGKPASCALPVAVESRD